MKNLSCKLFIEYKVFFSFNSLKSKAELKKYITLTYKYFNNNKNNTDKLHILKTILI